MRFFTLPSLVAAALLSAVVVLPLLPGAKKQPDLFALEAELLVTAAGDVQAFFDSGTGFSEAASSRTAVSPSTTPTRIRLGVPTGSFRALRLDPLDRPGIVRISRVRVVGPDGHTVRDLPLSDFQGANQIASLERRDGTLEVVTAPNANDPQLLLQLAAPIELRTGILDHLAKLLPRAAVVFAAIAALLYAIDRAPRFRALCSTRSRAMAQRPFVAVAAIAAAATVLSAYPVVFLGKSYVSPNFGTTLLYDAYPTLPGYKDPTWVDVKLSDVGAVMWQHVPFSMIQHRALSGGELPLWNRYNAAGVPLLAQGQSMFGDPLHLLVVAANGAAWAWDLKYLIAKWLFAAGLGLTVLAVAGRPSAIASGPVAAIAPASENRWHVLLPAAIVAFAAPFIGFFIYRINHPAFFSVCYAPWPLYCFVRVAQASSFRAVTGWAVVLIVSNLALMNSGTVKEAYMLLLCMNLAGAAVVISAAETWTRRLLKVMLLAWAGLIFVLLTAPIWATFLNTLKSAYTGYNIASAYQVQATLLLALFDEIFYRPLQPEERVFNPSLNFLLLLGFLYFVATLRTQVANRAAMAVAICSLVPLSLAFGLVPPRWIESLPFLANVAHIDNTFSCALVVLWTVLAGVGFAAAAQRLSTRDGRGDLAIVALLAGALVFGWISFGHAQHRPISGPTVTVNQPGEGLLVSPIIWEYLLALLLASAGLALTARRIARQRALTVASALVLVTCVAVLLWRHGFHASSVGLEDYTARPTTRVDFHARSEAVRFAQAAHAREPGRGFGLRGNFFPGWTGAYGLETIHGPDALVNPWLRELIGASGVERIWDWRLYVEPLRVGEVRPFFDALNVRYYFDLMSDQGVMGRALKLLKTADLDVYESPTAWPRAFFTDRLAVYDQPAEFIKQIVASNGRPLAAIQRSDLGRTPAAANIGHDLAARTVQPGTNYTLTENSTSFRVQASGPGAIVLTEAFWPDDFRATVNGKRAPVVRLNHAFKGVLVEAPGEYEVTFRYRPRHYFRNMMFSLTGAIFLIGTIVVAVRPRRLPIARHVLTPGRERSEHSVARP